MIKYLVLFLFLFSNATAAFDDDKIDQIPGYPSGKVTAYAGYLSTESSLRKLHYVFLMSTDNSTTKPVTLWLNGGPGCSSKIGFLQ